jgi:hypothetical protein
LAGMMSQAKNKHIQLNFIYIDIVCKINNKGKVAPDA